MTPFVKLSGAAAALRRDNVDTDIIIPMEELLTVPFERLGSVAFRPIRFRADGSPEPTFVLNRPGFGDAKILVAGRNFGSGSSREAAVSAIAGMGIRAIIASSFGDIFYGNCFKNGLLPVRLPDHIVVGLMDEADALGGGAPFTIDLIDQMVTTPAGTTGHFDVEEGLKQRLLAGEDDIDVTLKHMAAIADFQSRDRRSRPWVWAIEREGLQR